MVVFVTPLYYFGMSAQLKAVIDRFYSFNGRLTSKGVKTALIAAAWDSNDWTMKDLEDVYKRQAVLSGRIKKTEIMKHFRPFYLILCLRSFLVK